MQLKHTINAHGISNGNSLAYSSDGKTLASAGTDQKVMLWDAATGKKLLLIKVRDSALSCVALSPDGKTLVYGSHGIGAKFQFFDLKTRKNLDSLKRDGLNVLDAVFSPNGQILATSSYPYSKRICFWDVRQRKQIASFVGDNVDGVICMA